MPHGASIEWLPSRDATLMDRLSLRHVDDLQYSARKLSMDSMISRASGHLNSTEYSRSLALSRHTHSDDQQPLFNCWQQALVCKILSATGKIFAIHSPVIGRKSNCNIFSSIKSPFIIFSPYSFDARRHCFYLKYWKEKSQSQIAQRTQRKTILINRTFAYTLPRSLLISFLQVGCSKASFGLLFSCSWSRLRLTVFPWDRSQMSLCHSPTHLLSWSIQHVQRACVNCIPVETSLPSIAMRTINRVECIRNPIKTNPSCWCHRRSRSSTFSHYLMFNLSVLRLVRYLYFYRSLREGKMILSCL